MKIVSIIGLSVRLAAAGLAVILSGCSSVGPEFQLPPTKLEHHWQEIPTGLSIDKSGAFWSDFRDPVLIQVIAHAVKNNPTFSSAAHSIELAQSQLNIDRGNSLPSINLNTSLAYQQPTLASELRGRNSGATTQQLFGQLAWELDFWGKWRRTVEVDEANLGAASMAFAAARVSLEASVATAYFNLRVLEIRSDVAHRNLVEQAENLRITRTRYRLGATSELDLRQSEAQYEQSTALLPDLQRGIKQNQHALSILMGEVPDYFIEHFPGIPPNSPSVIAGTTWQLGLPAMPNALPLSTPRELLRRRPDIIQAEYAAAAQSARIGIATASLYPSVTLNGALGYSTNDGFPNLAQWANRAAAYELAVNLPIFDRQRINEAISAQRSLYSQAVLNYQSLVLKAQQEVDDALAEIDGYSQQLHSLQLADTAAARTSMLAQLRYRAGQVDYTTVVTAVQAHLQSSDSVVQAQGNVVQSYINAFRALGGGWSEPSEE